MKCRQFVAMAVLLAVAIAGPAAVATHAQDKPKEDRVSGTVEILNKETKTIVIQGTGGEQQKQVVYDDKTKITKNNKPGEIGDVQNGKRLICVGKLNDKGQLMASHCDVRPSQ